MTDETRPIRPASSDALPADIEALLDRAEGAPSPQTDAGPTTDAPTEEAAPAAPRPEDEPVRPSKAFSWKAFLGGDILAHNFFRRQVGLLVMLVIYAFIYISNRYNVQQQMIEIDRLKQELTDIKYDALTRSSELTEKSRQSRIEDYVSQEQSDLQTSTHPPYLIE